MELEQVQKAINEYYSTVRPRTDTLDGLDELASQIEVLSDCLAGEIEAEEDEEEV